MVASLVHRPSISSLKLLSQFQLKVHTQPPGKGGNKVYMFGPGHIPKMTKGETKFIYLVQVTYPRWLSCPYMVKALKDFSRTTEPIVLELGM